MKQKTKWRFIILQFELFLFKVCTDAVHAAQFTYLNRTSNQVIIRLVVQLIFLD